MKNKKPSLNNNGDNFDFDNFGVKPKKTTRLENLYTNLIKINPSIVLDLTQISKKLLENQKQNLGKINEGMTKKLNLLNSLLESYNDTMKSINNKSLNNIEIQQLKTVFSKLYQLIDTEKNKLLFLKSFEITENNGVKSIELNRNTLENIEVEYGIKNPYKDLNTIEESIEKTNKEIDVLENLKIQKNLNLEELNNNEGNKFNLTQIEQGTKSLSKELKTLDKDLEEKIKKLEKLKEQKIEAEKNFAKSSLKTVLNIFNTTSNATLGIKMTKSLTDNMKDKVFNEYKIKESTMNIKSIINKLEQFGKEFEGNISKLQDKLKNEVVAKDEKVEIQFDQPSMRGLRPVNGMSM